MQKLPRSVSSYHATFPLNRSSGLPHLAPESVEYRGYFQIEAHPSHSVIYRPGDPADRVYILRKGRVRLVRTGPTGTRSVTGILRPGDLFGELLRPEGTVLDEFAIAAGETEVWSIDNHSFQQLLESRPHLALDVIRALEERNRAMRRRLLGLTFKEVPARLADTLLVLADTHGDPCPHGGEYDLRGITQQDLADLVGASRSFVSTLINEMKRDGLLGNVGRILCIRDVRGLRERAAFEK